MRYAGQGHEIMVALPDRVLVPADVATFRQDFEREYSRLFARHIPDAEIEIMSWMVIASTPSEAPVRLAGRRAEIGAAAGAPALDIRCALGRRRPLRYSIASAHARYPSKARR